jgi:phosphatidylinositol alpha-1,6-mannosyltransferase
LQWAHYWAYLLCCERNTITYYRQARKKILFLSLSAFHFTGGIEKFNRAFLKALSDLEKEGKLQADSLSAYDRMPDCRYFNPQNYRGFKGNRVRFVINAWKIALNYDTIILGHINLSLVGWGIKKMFPNKTILLVAHGIEVWEKRKGVKKFILQNADLVLAVSTYTKNTIINVHQIPASRIRVFHNTIDPYFSYPARFEKPQYLMNRYGISKNDPVIFTLTRLSASEKYKGYDRVMQILPSLKKTQQNIKYVLGGHADEKESKRLDELKQINNLLETVVLTGFIDDKEVVDHFLLADVFVMPSRKEGFGIVFIEAMGCGLQVIGGNKDGSADAMQQGLLGQLVDPDSEADIVSAIEHSIVKNKKNNRQDNRKELQEKVKKTFGFEVYRENLEKLLL